MSHSLDQIAENLQSNAYVAKTHFCAPIDVPGLPFRKFYSVVPDSETLKPQVFASCLNHINTLSYGSSSDSRVGVVSINGTGIGSGLFISTMDWNSHGPY